MPFNKYDNTYLHRMIKAEKKKSLEFRFWYFYYGMVYFIKGIFYNLFH